MDCSMKVCSIVYTESRVLMRRIAMHCVHRRRVLLTSLFCAVFVYAYTSSILSSKRAQRHNKHEPKSKIQEIQFSLSEMNYLHTLSNQYKLRESKVILLRSCTFSRRCMYQSSKGKVSIFAICGDFELLQ